MPKYKEFVLHICSCFECVYTGVDQTAMNRFAVAADKS